MMRSIQTMVRRCQDTSMDDGKNERLLACYRQWAHDAGVPASLLDLIEREAREDYRKHPEQSIAEMFYGSVRHLVLPDTLWRGYA